MGDPLHDREIWDDDFPYPHGLGNLHLKMAKDELVLNYPPSELSPKTYFLFSHKTLNPNIKKHNNWTMNIYSLQCEAPKIAKLVYNSNNYGLWYS
jgi:hypothetical protein